MAVQGNSFIPDDPLEEDVPDTQAMSDIANMAAKRSAFEAGNPSATPIPKEIVESSAKEEPSSFVPDSFVPDSVRTEPSSFVPDSFKPDEPSWLDQVKEDWKKAEEEDSGLGILPAFMRARLERGVKRVGEGLKEHVELNAKISELRGKQRKGIATPEELESLAEVEKKSQEQVIDLALNWGPAAVGGKIGDLKGMFKELWGRGEEAVPAKVMKKAEDLVDEYEARLLKESLKGKPAHEAMQEVEYQMGRTSTEIDDLLFLTQRELRYPTKEEAQAAIASSRAASIEEREVVNGRGIMADLLVPISTRIKEMSDEVFGALREFEYKIRTGYHEGFSAAEPFLERIEKLGANNQRAVKRALLQGDFDIVRRFIGRDTEALKSFDKSREVLKGIFERQKEVGLKAKEIENYWPRTFINTKKALKQMGVEERSAVIKAFSIKKKQLGRELTEMEKSEVIHKTLFGRAKVSNAPGHLKERKYDRIPDKYLDFYASPRQALHYYMRDTILDLEKRAFLGKQLTRRRGTQSIDWESSLTKALKNNFKLVEDTSQFNELKRLLQARFHEGEASPVSLIQTARNITYSGTLGNPLSAITQLQDIGLAFQKFGVWNTLKTLVGKRNVTAMDFGLRDASIELLHSPSATARWMERVLKYSGFSRMDQFGKETMLNAALNKNWKLAQTEKGRNILAKEWEKTLGEVEMAKTLQDLKDKKMTDNVKLLLWNQLSNVQPISLLEMPLKYLQMPNGRILYALKSFTLRQIDLMLNDTFRMMKQGRVREGAKNLAGYAVFLSALGIGTDTLKKFLTGQEVSIDNIPDQAVTNALKIFGGSEFMASLAGSGYAGSAIVKAVTPAPISIIDSVGSDVINQFTKEDANIKSMQYVPIVGKFAYWWFGPGLDKIAQDAKAKEKE